MKPLQYARTYLERYGWQPIPVPHGREEPAPSDWQDLRLTEEDLPEHFNGEEQNLGVLLGEPSNGLIDVALNCPEALALAPHLLEPTLRFGRASAPKSHWLYAADPPVETFEFEIPDETREGEGAGETLVELRSTGCQTLFPPSVHPSGEEIQFENQRGPTEITGEELFESVRQLAVACLFLRNWPRGAGSRQDHAFAMAGALTRAGLPKRRVGRMIGAVAHEAGEAEAEKHARAARYAAERRRRGDTLWGWPKVRELFGAGCARCARRWLREGALPECTPESAPGAEKAPEDASRDEETQAEKLLRLASGAQLFHAPDGTPYATIEEDGAARTVRIYSDSFENYLRLLYYEAEGRPPSPPALQEARGVLAARAEFDGAEHEVHVRVAGHSGKIYVDLCDGAWEVVEIDAEGWRVKAAGEVPVKFRRAKGMKAMPRPKRGGSLELLRRHVRVELEEFVLLLAFLVQALRPSGPYPVLVFVGEQGTGKTTISRMIRALIDPFSVPTSTQPRNARDLAISAENSHLLAFNNLSGVPLWFSDALCRLSDGSGLRVRTHYKNREEELFFAERPIVLNGIEDLTTRPDLADRALVVELEPIPKTERKTEAELWEAFDRDAPLLVGALFDAIATALASEKPRPEGLERMADFAVWADRAEAAFPVENGTFLEAFGTNRGKESERAVENDPVAAAIRALLEEEGAWEGKTSELVEALKAYLPDPKKPPRDYPESYQAMGARLRRIMPVLRAVGICRKEGLGPKGRAFRLYKEGDADGDSVSDGEGAEEAERRKKRLSQPSGDSASHSAPPAAGSGSSEAAGRSGVEKQPSEPADGDHSAPSALSASPREESNDPPSPGREASTFSPRKLQSVMTPEGPGTVVKLEGRTVEVEIDSAGSGEPEAFDLEDVKPLDAPF